MGDQEIDSKKVYISNDRSDVCFPIVRNNTYLLYEKGFRNGLLVEPNVRKGSYEVLLC